MYGVESKKQEQVLDTRGKFALSIAYVSFAAVWKKSKSYWHIDFLK